MEGKKRLLVDGILRRRPTTPNVIMALLKTTLGDGEKSCVNEKVRWTSVTPNMILAQLKASRRRQ